MALLDKIKKKLILSFLLAGCILHNIILEADGLDTRWETDVDWDILNSQNDNNDDQYDNDSDIEVSNAFVETQEQRILSRVSDWEAFPSLIDSVEGTKIEFEVDVYFDVKKRRML
jgi:hypothetical protein